MDDSATNTPYSLGVEEELAIVDPRNGMLVPGYDRLMQRASAEARAHMKPEFLQSFVECITSVCPNVAAVDRETRQLRATASALARAAGYAIAATGTHPNGRWWDQIRAGGARYAALEDALQDIARSILIFGLHVHVNIGDLELRIKVMSQARNFLPQILALSSNSPFWMGRKTGFQSYRMAVWSAFPMSGIPPIFADADEYNEFIALMQGTGAVSDVRRVWWDVRSHDKFPTLEYRIADIPTRHEDVMAIIAFIQALTKTLVERTEAGNPLPAYPSEIIYENRFRASLDGLRGTQIDYATRQAIPTTQAIAATLGLIAPAAAELQLGPYMAHLQRMIAPGYRTGAERQLDADAHARHPDATRYAVVEMLIRDTMAGIDPALAFPLLEPPPPEKLKRSA